MIPGTVVLCLFLLIIRHWIQIPTWLIAGIVTFSIIKDVVIFPFVWRSYDWDRPGLSRAMIAARGFARDRLDPIGYVRVYGELWKAEIEENATSIEKGAAVKVIGMKGLRLIVEQDDAEK
jgi:membrane-bound ClpP family serine protease